MKTLLHAASPPVGRRHAAHHGSTPLASVTRRFACTCASDEGPSAEAARAHGDAQGRRRPVQSERGPCAWDRGAGPGGALVAVGLVVRGSRAPSEPNASAASGMRISRVSALVRASLTARVARSGAPLWGSRAAAARRRAVRRGRRSRSSRRRRPAGRPRSRSSSAARVPAVTTPPARAASAATQPGPSSATVSGTSTHSFSDFGRREDDQPCGADRHAAHHAVAPGCDVPQARPARE